MSVYRQLKEGRTILTLIRTRLAKLFPAKERSERGAILVEATLALPLFLMAAFMIFDVSTLLRDYGGAALAMNSASRELQRQSGNSTRDLGTCLDAAGAVFLDELDKFNISHETLHVLDSSDQPVVGPGGTAILEASYMWPNELGYWAIMHFGGRNQWKYERWIPSDWAPYQILTKHQARLVGLRVEYRPDCFFCHIGWGDDTRVKILHALAVAESETGCSSAGGPAHADRPWSYFLAEDGSTFSQLGSF